MTQTRKPAPDDQLKEQQKPLASERQKEPHDAGLKADRDNHPQNVEKVPEENPKSDPREISQRRP